MRQMHALFFYLTLFTLMTLSRAYTFQKLSRISTGRIDLINLNVFNTGSIPYNYTTTFSSVMASVTQAGVSLISFSGMVSMDFACNISVLSFTTSSMQVSGVTYNRTYLTLLSAHFIASDFNYLDIRSGCFFCSGLISGQGTRSQSFSNLFSAFTLSPTNPLLITTVISGLSIHNPNGGTHKMEVSSSIASGSSLINLTVTAYEQNQLQYVCVTILIYRTVQTTAGNIYYRKTNTISNTPGTFSFLPYPSIFQTANVMFFGFSYLDILFTPVPTKAIIIKTDNFADISAGSTATPNINQIKLEQFFLIYTDCDTSPGYCFYYGTYTCNSGAPPGTTPNSLGVCVPCNPLCNTCNGLGANNCLTCESSSPVYRTLNTNTCDCLDGYVDNGVLNCGLCSDTLTSLCLICSTNATCTTCAFPFVPSSGICVCPPGMYLVSGNCTSLIGCTDIVPISSGPYCDDCDKALGFSLTVSRTCGCIAGTTLAPNNTECIGVCQDGYHLSNQECDMGPYVVGNGCAPNCTIVPNFYCSDRTRGGISICVPIMAFKASYIYAERVVGFNSAILYFKISPPDPILTNINFNNTVSFTFPLSGISCKYDLATSLLSVTLAYTQSIEDKNVSATIKFDDFFVHAAPAVANFTSIGVNYELSFDSNLSINSILNLMAIFIGILSVTVALIVTLFGHKLLGFELMLSVQAIFFSTVCLSSPTVQLYSFQGLEYSTGYNIIAPFSLSQDYDMLSGLITVGYEKDFLMNFNFMAIPLLLSSLLLFFLNIVMKRRGKDSQQLKSSQPFVAETFLEKIYVFLLDKIFPFVVALTLSRVVFSYVVQFAKKNSSTMIVDSFQSGGFGSLCLLTLMQSLYFLYRQCRKRASPLKFQGASKRYAIVLLMEYLSINCILSMLFFIQISIYIALVLSMVPTIVNIFMRPYGKLLSLSSFASLLCSIGFFFAVLCMVIIENHLPEIIIIILVIIDFSILAFAEFYILIIAIYMNYCSKKEPKAEEVDPVKTIIDKDNVIATAAIRQNLLVLEGNAAILWDHSSVKKNIEMDDSARDLGVNFMKEDVGQEDEELTRLKRRLKQEMKEKKVGVKIERNEE